MKINLSLVTAPALSSIGACSETDRQVMHGNNFVLIALIRNVKLLSNVLLHFFFNSLNEHMWDIHNILWLFFTEMVTLMSLQMPQKFRALNKGNIITLSTACLFFLHFYNVYICKKKYIYIYICAAYMT